MNPVLIWISGLILGYFMFSTILSIVFAKIPRKPLSDKPDWGKIEEVKIPTARDKNLEAWVVYPEDIKSNVTIVLTHGWARNRGRMVDRARIFGKSGYITILFSARDHGGSDRELFGMNIYRFSQDVKSVVNWWNKPVLLVGHSIGAGASLLATPNLSQVKGLVVDAPPYAIPESLGHIYRPVLKGLTPIFMPAMHLIVKLFFVRLPSMAYSPKMAAKEISKPTLVVHGEEDELLPYEESILLVDQLENGELLLLDNCNHHNLEQHPKYEEKVLEFAKLLSN